MTKTTLADGRQRVTDSTAAVSSLTSSVRVLLPPPETDCYARQPLIKSVVHAARVSAVSMPIHDPATLEKFRQAATACRTTRSGQRAKSRSISISDASVAVATGNGGVGRSVESTALVPLSTSSFGCEETLPPTAESRFFPQHAIGADDDETVDDCERSRRGRSRRRTLAVVTTARWLQHLRPSKSGGSHAATTPRSGERPPPPPPLSPPAFALTSDDESATSDAETNLLRRPSDRQDVAKAALDVREGDNGDQRRSRDTFYSSTATDRFRLSTGSDSASTPRPLSSGDESYSPEVFQCTGDNSDASESCTVTHHSGRCRSSSDTDALRPSVTTTKNDPSTGDTDGANRIFDAARIDLSVLKPNTRPALRFDLIAKSFNCVLMYFCFSLFIIPFT